MSSTITAAEKPYLEHTVVKYRWNPKYDPRDEKKCVCGHLYYRHFDSYEDMYPVGCKYCSCNHFVCFPMVPNEN